MSFSPGGGDSSSIAGSADVALSNPENDQFLVYSASTSKWRNFTLAVSQGSAPATYALGRVKYSTGWPTTRPTGYAYIDWIKSSVSDSDPDANLMVAGDTISEWQ